VYGTAQEGWRSLLRREWALTLAVLMSGVLLQSMNVLMLSTVLPTIVGELGGVAMMSWPTTAYLASSITAATCAALLAATLGVRATYCAGVTIFGAGALFCSLAPSMGWIVAGRLVQGFGGGLEAAVAYVVVRRTLPESMWPRAIALLSGMWSVSVLMGPLVGGIFARLGDWRGAFISVALIAALLTVGAFVVLRSAVAEHKRAAPGMPVARVGLICLAIAGTSAASTVAAPLAKAGLIALAVLSLTLMLRLNRRAPIPLLPRDAFFPHTPTGAGLWLVLLLCITFSPLQLYVPIFLQRLHGLDPLAAGYAVAGASMGWTAASLASAGAAGVWRDRLMVAGPIIMGIGLMGIALLMPRPTSLALYLAIVVVGVGIGQCWAFVAHRVMSGAKSGDETVAAASVPTVQQMGFALGAALAGLAANASGLANEASSEGITHAAFWVPASFIVPAAVAWLASLRLRRLAAPFVRSRPKSASPT
jgi:MFS family permease